MPIDAVRRQQLRRLGSAALEFKEGLNAQMEPGTKCDDLDLVATSIAISLKRIADSMDKGLHMQEQGLRGFGKK